MYTLTIISPIKDTIFFPYEYEYNLRHNFVPLDTVLNPVLDDQTIEYNSSCDNLEGFYVNDLRTNFSISYTFSFSCKQKAHP